MSSTEALGWLLFTIGFLAAAVTAMRIPPLWSWFLPFLFLSFAGAYMARVGAGGSHDDTVEAIVHSEPRDAETLLKSIEAALNEIDTNGEEEYIKARIEALQYGALASFAEERRRFLQRYGPRCFASFFAAFARAERNVNRAWSALTDGHRGEMETSLKYAKASVVESLASLPKD